MDSTGTASRIDLTDFFTVWLKIGLQSFGGGISTFALIREAAIRKFQWVTEEEFLEIWAMVQVAPGINLIALTILLGKRGFGNRGIVAALLGLLLPTVLLTGLITAGYTKVQHLPITEAAIRGAIPAIVGLGIVTSVQTIMPLLRSAVRDNRPTMDLLVYLLIVLGSACAAARNIAPIFTILLASAFCSGVYSVATSRRRSSGQLNEEPQ